MNFDQAVRVYLFKAVWTRSFRLRSSGFNCIAARGQVVGLAWALGFFAASINRGTLPRDISARAEIMRLVRLVARCTLSQASFLSYCACKVAATFLHEPRMQHGQSIHLGILVFCFGLSRASGHPGEAGGPGKTNGWLWGASLGPTGPRSTYLTIHIFAYVHVLTHICDIFICNAPTYL